MMITPDLGSTPMRPLRDASRAPVPAMMASAPRPCLKVTRDGRRDSEEDRGVAWTGAGVGVVHPRHYGWGGDPPSGGSLRRRPVIGRCPSPTRTKLGTGWSSWTCADRVVSDRTYYFCGTSP
jgi:hypothetical protein